MGRQYGKTIFKKKKRKFSKKLSEMGLKRNGQCPECRQMIIFHFRHKSWCSKVSNRLFSFSHTYCCWNVLEGKKCPDLCYLTVYRTLSPKSVQFFQLLKTFRIEKERVFAKNFLILNFFKKSYLLQKYKKKKTSTGCPKS